MTPARRRGLLLLCFALVCGGIAAARVREHERRAEAALGPLVSAVVAKRELPADHRLGRDDLAVTRAPARFLPPDALGTAGALTGATLAVSIAAGGYVTATMIQGTGGRDGGGALRAGERSIELPVAGGAALAGAEQGARVDVLLSMQREQGAGRTFVALENVELLALRAPSGEAVAPTGGDGGAAEIGTAAAPTALATLRVTARQAVYLAAASNFAHEVRLLVRPPGDLKRVGTAAVQEAGL
ncbi:MAG: pilus assembly protein CpaB [Thermoleophilaceae bacterium]|jgi:pilus assembly protein CpaB|nr:pilus assembly protein CpaB [Thermoleophilaceae bacterium]